MIDYTTFNQNFANKGITKNTDEIDRCNCLKWNWEMRTWYYETDDRRVQDLKVR